MLPKIHRLTKKKEFDLVFKKGNSVKSHFLLCKTLKNDVKESRFGFVVSKKVSHKATVRNKIKRRLRKAAADLLKDVKKSADIILVALPGIEKKEFSEIQEAVLDVFKKIKLI